MSKAEAKPLKNDRIASDFGFAVSII